MPFAILHISDIHRSQSDPISNDELLSTLLSDCDRSAQESPPVPLPDAIVVSGDLVHGVPLGQANYESVLREQYGVALEFLCRLADELVAGDRSRVAVVPGNHDVDWNTARAAMVEVPSADLPERFSPALCGPLGDYRLDWKQLRAFRIFDRSAYARRLGHFDETVAAFYAGTDVEATEYFRLHSWMDGRIGVAAFDSCVGNDCFAFHGAILEEAIAQAHLRLRGRDHDLLLALWHHSIEGGPTSGDFMAVDSVHRMIGKGFRLGLHGHQHHAEATLRYVHLPGEERMAVVSAGSLCAGRYELPVGVNRQYNVIELAHDLTSVRVHVREMAIATTFAPARRVEFGGRSYVDLEWEQPPAMATRALHRSQAAVLAAEKAVAAEDFGLAAEVLRRVPIEEGSYARILLLEALRRQPNSFELLIETFDRPASVDELVAATMARVEIDDTDGAIAFLDEHATRLQFVGAPAEELRRAIGARRALQ